MYPPWNNHREYGNNSAFSKLYSSKQYSSSIAYLIMRSDHSYTLIMCVYIILSVCVDVSIKILNAGAWARASERISVSLPTELEDLVPNVEEFYKRKHNGRKLQWNNLMSNGQSVSVLSYLVISLSSDLIVDGYCRLHTYSIRRVRVRSHRISLAKY